MNPQTILIVDDDPSTLRFLHQRLRIEGFRVVAAESGNEALKRLTEEEIDLVLLDVSMPEMSGYEVRDRMKDDPQKSRIPVMFLTVMDSREDERKGLQEGVIDYLSKEILTPDRIDLLIYRIRNFFSWQESERLRGILATIVSVNHEINNPLMVILADTHRLARSGKHEKECKEHGILTHIEGKCMEIKHCLKRISDLSTWASKPYVEGVEMLDLGSFGIEAKNP